MATNTSIQPPALNMGAPTSSLYVGDLHPDVTETMLFEKFSTAGQVLSIRVCRDAVTRLSLGYAYVNFQQHADAECVLKSMNFDPLLNRPIRIMWSQRDPSIRRSGAGNIFIKNLDKSIDTKSIYETFSFFGTILSCKVACDSEGVSKGYGFIHFEKEENALTAIEKVNGKLLDGKMVVVEKFIPRAARLKNFNETGKKFNNVYVKNFAELLDDEKLEALFKPFGPIISCVVMVDQNKVSRGFGFVCFEEAEHAEQAVEKLNQYSLSDSALKLTVCRAQKKSERQAELRRNYELKKMELVRCYQGVNLYVKNLDDGITDETLRQHFEPFGSITSVKVMRDENDRSKGFGFVCFEKPDDATKAVVEMNNKIIALKPLYVALAQRKEDRRQQLASQYMQRLAAMRMQNTTGLPGTVYAPAASGFFVQAPFQNQRTSYLPSHPGMNTDTHIRNSRQQVRWNGVNTSAFNQVGYAFGNNNFQKSQRRFPRPPQVQQPQICRLPNLHDETSTQSLGNRLYKAISKICNEVECGDVDIAKVTGMLMEMNHSDLSQLIEDQELLQNKLNEALTVVGAKATN